VKPSAAPSAARYDLLLVAADWEERRLLYAELLEAGYAVLPVPGVAYAARLLRLTTAPPVVLLDTQGDQDATPPRAKALLRLCPNSRLVVVVGLRDSGQWEPLRPRVAALVRRPVSIGEVVAAVRGVLPPARAEIRNPQHEIRDNFK
jgi:DNA-binding response OmpR family regulator